MEWWRVCSSACALTRSFDFLDSLGPAGVCGTACSMCPHHSLDTLVWRRVPVGLCSHQILQFPHLCEMYASERGLVWSDEYLEFAEKRQGGGGTTGVADKQSAQEGRGRHISHQHQPRSAGRWGRRRGEGGGREADAEKRRFSMKMMW